MRVRYGASTNVEDDRVGRRATRRSPIARPTPSGARRGRHRGVAVDERVVVSGIFPRYKSGCVEMAKTRVGEFSEALPVFPPPRSPAVPRCGGAEEQLRVLAGYPVHAYPLKLTLLDLGLEERLELRVLVEPSSRARLSRGKMRAGESVSRRENAERWSGVGVPTRISRRCYTRTRSRRTWNSALAYVTAAVSASACTAETLNSVTRHATSTTALILRVVCATM